MNYQQVLYQNRYYLLGILGALVVLFGHFQVHPDSYYVVGSSILLITAIHYSLVFFVALEIIFIAGHLAVALSLAHFIQIALPLFLCFQLFVFYLMFSKKNDLYLLIGVLGIGLLSSGFSYNKQWIFFTGGLAVATYAFHCASTGCKPAYIWAILNSIFVLFSIYNILI